MGVFAGKLSKRGEEPDAVAAAADGGGRQGRPMGLPEPKHVRIG